jgi:NAD+ synthase (glutamine-hydrolysing)
MIFSIVQENPIVGALSYNLSLIETALKNSEPGLLVFSECFLTGYPPKDLLLSKPFLNKLKAAISDLLVMSKRFPQHSILLGSPFEEKANLYNAVLLIENGMIIEKRFKQLLPEYDVFEEKRYFKAADENAPIVYKDVSLGVLVCEDGWSISENSPTSELKKQGIDLLINLSASPFNAGKYESRLECFKEQAKMAACPVLYVNQFGSNTELVFDGRSFCLDSLGELVWAAPAFEACLQTFDFTEYGIASRLKGSIIAYSDVELIYLALVLGIKDYFSKTGFKKAVLGLSGGIDSALTCSLAVKALGAENVIGISMPSDYSSDGSILDAQGLADNLGVSLIKVPIHDLFNTYKTAMPVLLDPEKRGLAYENTQARIRGTIVMTYANSYNALALATGNKSELSVGYSTLYGDMCGALMVIGDLTKSKVYDLSRYINSGKELIPEKSISKPPSAELRPNQTDQDSLPDYDILDAIIEALIENDCSVESLYKSYPKETVNKITRLIEINEHKRNQAPPVLRITKKAFGIGRRIPIVKRG